MKNHIKEMLEKRSMTVNEFVNKAGISRSLGSSLINSETIPPKTRFDTIQGVLKALQCQFSDIATPEISMHIEQKVSLDKISNLNRAMEHGVPKEKLSTADELTAKDVATEHTSLVELDITVEDLKYKLALLINNRVPNSNSDFAYEDHYSNRISVVPIEDAEKLSDLNSEVKPFHNTDKYITDTDVIKLIVNNSQVLLKATQSLINNSLLYFPDKNISEFDGLVIWDAGNSIGTITPVYANYNKSNEAVAELAPLQFSDSASSMHISGLMTYLSGMRNSRK